MAVETKQDVQVSVGADYSTVTFGGSKVAVSVSKYFKTVVLNGVTIERVADNHLVISAPGIVITKPGVSNDSKKPLEPGDKREDGWAYVGVDNGQNVFAKGYGVKKWEEAMAFAAGEKAHLGSDAELDLLQTTLDKGLLKDSFNVSGSGWVWGSRRGPDSPDNLARVQRLSDGDRFWSRQDFDASVVLFRAEPRP